jgi:hypothetical protein
MILFVNKVKIKREEDDHIERKIIIINNLNS